MAGLPLAEFVVDGNRYRATALPAIAGRKLYLRVLKAAAPGLAVIAGAKDGDADSAVLGLIATVVQNLDVQLFDDLCDQMAAQTVLLESDRQIPLSSVFEVHFSARYQPMVQWLLECLKVNKFLDFLPGNAGLGKPGSVAQ
jgi:hypothetical protein